MALCGTHWPSWREEGGVAAPEPPRQAVFEAGILGLAVISAAMALAARQPPPWLHPDAYFVALSGVFFVGVVQVTASVWATTGGRRATAGKKLLQVSAVALLGVAAGLELASLLL
ncbi:hypothetical protein HU200_055472 [Digitaria exilis]|uniref:Uncharacterized protein n=1 Tax=Digitaria exilis TaxID=1010633 RepID=A0A835AGI9_9POAL|nr:hypothetical protein HU200_055472 [Digitaria exilis]CAB3472234.1 unnamed protein product [Digitaria exilis]